MPANSKYTWEQPDYSKIVAANSALMPVGTGQAGRDARKQRIAAGQARRAARPGTMTGTQFSPLSEAMSQGFGQQQLVSRMSAGSVPIGISPPSFAQPATANPSTTGRIVPEPPQPMPPSYPQGLDPGVPVSPSPLSRPVQQSQPMSPQFSAAGTLADAIAARRAAGGGVGGPTPQAMGQFNSAVQSRLANPSPGSLGDFTRGEYGRTEAGREVGRQAMDQSYLSQPMQGGGMPMADREARLSMLSPPGQRAQADSDFMARRSQTGSMADETVRDELMRQGVTQEQLDNIAELRNDPDIAMGGRRAVSLLAPGTSIRTPEGGFIMRGPDRETTPEDLERKQAGRLRDVQAPMERMDKVRAGRQAMMANRSAAQQQAYDMATNPVVNPMLVANSPYALSAVIQAQQDQREFASGSGRRQLEEEGLRLQNRAAEQMLNPETLKQAQQDQAIKTLGTLPQEMWSSPLGRALQARAMGTVGNEPATPQTALDAQSNAVALAPSLAALIGGDPSQYRTASELLSKVRELQTSGIPVSEQDQQALEQYVQSRSMYDADFASNTEARPVMAAQGFGDWLMKQTARPFSPPMAPGSRPQAIPPQFLYPRMGG